MLFDLERYHRHAFRLEGHDYGGPGLYLVTICTYDKNPLFGSISSGICRLSDCGEIVEEEWVRTAELRSNVQLGVFVVMPNHFHGILHIGEKAECQNQGAADSCAGGARGVNKFGRPVSGSLATVIGAFKSAVSKRIHRLPEFERVRVWQPRYHERIIWSKKDLLRARAYISLNPSNVDR